MASPIAEQPQATGMPEHRQVLCFQCDEQEYSVDIRYVREIIRLVAITPIPDAPTTVLGVINLRGTVIPIVDMRIKMGMRRNPLELSTPIIVTSLNRKTVGLIVDRVTEVATIHDAETQAIPSTLEHLTYLSGVAKIGKRLIHCVDLSEMIRVGETPTERRRVGRPWAETETAIAGEMAGLPTDMAR